MDSPERTCDQAAAPVARAAEVAEAAPAAAALAPAAAMAATARLARRLAAGGAAGVPPGYRSSAAARAVTLHGNAYVQALARQSHSASTQHPDLARAQALLQRATAVQTAAGARHTAVTTFIAAGLSQVDEAAGHLNDLCNTYDAALAQVRARLSRAGAAIASEDALVDAALGVVIGVGIGLGVGAVMPLAEGAGLAARAGQGVVSKLGSWAVTSTATGALGAQRSQVAAGLQAPQGATAQRLHAAIELGRLYRRLAQLGTDTEPVARLMTSAGDAVTELTVQSRGGSATVDLDEAERRVAALEQIEGAQSAIDGDLAQMRTALAGILADARRAATTPRDRIEANIWIVWMGGLSSQAANRIIDDDAIEDRLREVGVIGQTGRAGILAVDFGSWTSQDDTDEARLRAHFEAARMEMVGLPGIVKELAGGGSAWILVQGRPRLLEATVSGGTPTVGAAVVVTGSSHERLQARLAPGADTTNVDIWGPGPRPHDLEYEGTAHPVPGHI
jgi:hypothetical protein